MSKFAEPFIILLNYEFICCLNKLSYRSVRCAIFLIQTVG